MNDPDVFICCYTDIDSTTHKLKVSNMLLNEKGDVVRTKTLEDMHKAIEKDITCFTQGNLAISESANIYRDDQQIVVIAGNGTCIYKIFSIKGVTINE